MKRLEQFIHNIRNRYYKRLGYLYDHGKRMWYRTRSVCCNATVHGVAMYNGKPLTKPFSQYNDKQRPNIYYRDWCDECHRQCTTVTTVVT